MFFALAKLRPRTLRTKLLLWYTAVFAVSAVLLVAFVYALAGHQLTREMDIYVQDESEEYVRLTRGHLPDLAEVERHVGAEVSRKQHYLPFYRLVDGERGTVLVELPRPAPGIVVDADLIARALNGEETVKELKPVERRRNTYLVRTVAFEAGGRRYVLQSGLFLKRLTKRLRRLRGYLMLSVPVILLVAVAGGAFLAGRSLKPTAEIVRRLGEIRSADLALRLPDSGIPDELGSLIAAINAMLEELQASFERTRSFTADVAHELRTPLATLICQLEVAVARDRPPEEYQAELSAALERAKDLARVVDDLLFLARTDAAEHLPGAAATDLAAVVEELGETFGLVAQEKGVSLSLDVAAPLPVRGNPEWLAILVANLLDNAIKYTPPGGSVAVVGRSGEGRITVSVEDTGAGIAPEDLGRVFDRFYRADRSRSRETGGAGLGLSIAKHIAELHRGEITVTSRPGRGSRFELTLPERPGPA